MVPVSVKMAMTKGHERTPVTRRCSNHRQHCTKGDRLSQWRMEIEIPEKTDR